MKPPVDPNRCPLCGAVNDCGLTTATSNSACWCAVRRMPRELLARVPKPARNRACICIGCLDRFEKAKTRV